MTLPPKKKKVPKPQPWRKNAPHGTTERSRGTVKWVSAIPQAQGHGSGILQKKLWRLVSDGVRIRDVERYGVCAATGQRINHYTECDAGHWKSYSVCRGLYKFNPQNIHAQSKQSNAWGGQETGHQFAETLKKRYGNDIIERIQEENKRTPLKFTKQEILDEMEWWLAEMASFKIKPPYWKRAYTLLNEERI